MNNKKAKLLRKMVKDKGLDPRQVEYDIEKMVRPTWIMAQLLNLPKTKVTMKEGCGRQVYQQTKGAV